MTSGGRLGRFGLSTVLLPLALVLAACGGESILTPTPTLTPTPIPTVVRDLLEEPPKGPGAEIGKGYSFGLYVHCGVRDAYFDGRRWMANPILTDGQGNPNPPDGWASDDGVGTMTLVEEDLAVFRARSGREVEFVPWPPDVEWSPCV
ncbi:MAG: hypothetical protein IIB33_05795 [Chloroflexi bacterium]|nr:hypothetical protein [Chloroflexota bacterium]